MIDLLNKLAKGNEILYIFGNGFDLAHNMSTSYENFHQWLINNGHSSFVRDFENLYPDVKNRDGRWCDVESALGNISLKSAINFDLNYQECPDEIRNENSSHDAYRCGDNLKNIVDLLPGMLRIWVESVSTKEVCTQFELVKNAKYLSFNYTRTLEDVYSIKKDYILHIHETVIDRRPLVVGYGDAIFEDEEFVPDDEAIDVKLIKNILAHNRKPVDAIQKDPKPQSWFNSLNEIEIVIVYGHSCSKVDKPYFLKVAESINDDAHWYFYVHDKSKNKSIESFAKSILSKNQTFEIFNQ